jgi:hypothetical protein
MATIIIHAGHFKPSKINIRLGISANSIFFTPYAMRLTDVATGGVIDYKLEDLAELEVASEESTKKMMGAIGWGLVGDLALGPLGLLAGVLSGGKQTIVKFIGNFKDGRRMLATTDSKTFTAMQAALFNKTLAPISPPEPAPSANRRQVEAAIEKDAQERRESFVRFVKSPIVWGPIAFVVAVALIGGGGTKPAVQPTQVVQAAAPIVMSDGCDLAGAIPNCKAVMAELAAKGVKGTGKTMDATKPAEHASWLDKPIMSDGEWANFQKQVQQSQDRLDDANRAVDLSIRIEKDARARAEGRPIDWGGRALR